VQGQIRVLVVNDDPELLQSRCAVLNALGIEAVEAIGVAQAHTMASAESYAAVLIDATNVSFGHAMDLCSAIKQVKPWQKVIVLTRSDHVVSETDCPDVVVVREHPERMIPNIVAALRGDDVPVDGELAPEDSS
jgi:DNA-binding NtrC family response regulator